MRRWVCIPAAFLAGLVACEGTERTQRSVPQVPQDAGSAVVADLGLDAGAGAAPPAGRAVAAPAPSTPQPALRYRLGPLIRFRLVPVGALAVDPARSAIPVLQQRYPGLGFELGATVASLPSTAMDCDSFLTTRVGARGTVFVVAPPLPCPSKFGALDPRFSAAVVLLPPLGAAGSPEAARRLQALLASDVGELLGLSYPCADGRTCCLLRTAPDLRAFDARAAVSNCPQHAGELDRIRTDAGLQ
jgi:hypothetical protein